jgi:hypothetical protein
MKIAAFLCLMLVGQSYAVDCSLPADQRSFFTNLLCSVGDAAKQVGNNLLDTLKETAIQAATDLGGQLITGLQDVASAASNATVGKRNLDVATALKLAAFVEGHRDFVDKVGGLLQNVTQVTIAKLDGLIKDFTNNPNEDLLNKIVAYLQAHNVIQDEIMKWVKKNGNPIVTLMASELLHAHKRQTDDLMAQVAQVGTQLSSSFDPLVFSLQTLVGGMSSQLVQGFAQLVPGADQLLSGFQPSGATGDVAAAALGDILQGTLAQSTPDLVSLIAQVGASLLA